MTDVYYIEVLAEDLKLGSMFVAWALKTNPPVYGDPSRVLNIKDVGGLLKVYLADCRVFRLHPEHKVIIQELA